MAKNAIGKGLLTWCIHDLHMAIVSWRSSRPEREGATSNVFAGKESFSINNNIMMTFTS